MPSVRSLILLSVMIFVVSLFGAWLSLFRDPDSGGRGHDTFGTKGYGFRALFDALRELEVPVQRQLTPPRPSPSDKTIVLLQPDEAIVGTEPTYLRRLIPWIEQGGRLVVALTRKSQSVCKDGNCGNVVPLPPILETIGLAAVKVEIIVTLPVDGDDHHRIRRPMDEESFKDEMIKVFGSATPPARLVDVKIEGELQSLSVAKLALPGDEVQTLVCGKQPTEGLIQYAASDGENRILAAQFPRGAGHIVVVSDHALFRNRYLAQADNSVLAAQLFSPEGQPVVFDEFYHGLGVRGNPLFLMTRPGYAALLLGLLLVSCLIVWRQAVLLGPSLTDRTVNRRDIGEYLNAMGRFFSQGKRARPFLIEQVRDGVLRDLCGQLALATETQDLDTICGILSRRSVAVGERLKTVVTEIDAQLQSQTHWTEQQTIDALRRLTTCLSTKM